MIFLFFSFFWDLIQGYASVGSEKPCRARRLTSKLGLDGTVICDRSGNLRSAGEHGRKLQKLFIIEIVWVFLLLFFGMKAGESPPVWEARGASGLSPGTGKKKHGTSRDLCGGLRHRGRREGTDETSWVSKWRTVAFWNRQWMKSPGIVEITVIGSSAYLWPFLRSVGLIYAHLTHLRVCGCSSNLSKPCAVYSGAATSPVCHSSTFFLLQVIPDIFCILRNHHSELFLPNPLMMLQAGMSFRYEGHVYTFVMESEDIKPNLNQSIIAQ